MTITKVTATAAVTWDLGELRKTGRHTDRQAGRHTGKQTDRQTHDNEIDVFIRKSFKLYIYLKKYLICALIIRAACASVIDVI